MIPETLAFIPARGGSKGVPGKNKRFVAGRPLLEFSIEAARQSREVQAIVVSSDDPEILALATAAGAMAVRRPPEIAGDEAPVIDAVRHAVRSLDAEDRCAPRTIVLLQPTSPLRTGADIDAAVALYRASGRPVCSVYRVEDHHPARMYRIEEDRLVPLMPELAQRRRQDLPAIYHRNGALYVFGRAELSTGRIITADMMPYVMPPESAVNVDTELDLALLETVLRARSCKF